MCGADEFDGEVFAEFVGFACFEFDDFVGHVDAFVFADGAEDGCGEGGAEDWRVVFGGEVGYGADVVEVGVGDDDCFDLLPPVFDDVVLGDGFCVFESFFGEFDEGSFVLFGEFDVVWEVESHVEEDDFVVDVDGGHVFADFSPAADCFDGYGHVSLL